MGAFTCMRKCIFRAVAALAVVSFIVMISSVSASCTEGVSYTSEELDEYLESFNRRMAEEGWTVDNSDAGNYVDPKIAHPTEGSSSSGNATSKTSSGNDISKTSSGKATSKACDHKYDSTVTKEPTCGEGGIRTFTCTKCGDSYTESIPATGEHSYKSEVTQKATCVYEGITTFTCEVCGDTYEETIPLTEHDYNSCIAENATCTMDGVRVYICTVCDDSYTEVIPASGHGKLETVVEEPAGLFTKGKQITRCTVCGEVIETTDIPSKASSRITKIGDFFKNLFA